MSEDTLRYVRHDTNRRLGGGRRLREDHIGAKVVQLDGDPRQETVRAILLGVACDRGVGLGGGRIGAADGPQRFRDAFFRLVAPEGWAEGTVLDAGDLLSAGRSEETHARLMEVVDVLMGRFPAARLCLVGGGHDSLYGEVLGLARRLRRDRTPDTPRLGLVVVDACPDVAAHEGEPTHQTALRRLLREKAAGLVADDVLHFGAQPALTPWQHMRFLRGQAIESIELPETESVDLSTRICGLAERVDGLTVSIDLGALSQAVAPGVSEPSATGVDLRPLLRAAAMAGSLEKPKTFGIYGLTPRFDRDGATARVAARLCWSYCAGTA